MSRSRASERPVGAGLGSALIALVALGALTLVLVLRGDWLALGLLLPLAWLGWALPGLRAPAVSPEPAVSPGHSTDVLIRRLLPLWSAQIETAQHQLSEGVDGALNSFQGILSAQDALAQSLSALPEGPAHAALAQLTEQGDAALAALQVGDRVQQMLDVVKDDQRRLAAELAHSGALDEATAQRWLAELESRYTTQEQRDTHAGREAQAPGSPGVQFF